MAADTPVVVSPSGKGGARPGSGAKPKQHRIAMGELREALESKLGMPYVQMLAETQVKLFNDFKNDINVREYVRFTENMSNRILEQQKQEVEVLNGPQTLTDAQLALAIKVALTAQDVAKFSESTNQSL